MIQQCSIITVQDSRPTCMCEKSNKHLQLTDYYCEPTHNFRSCDTGAGVAGHYIVNPHINSYTCMRMHIIQADYIVFTLKFQLLDLPKPPNIAAVVSNTLHRYNKTVILGIFRNSVKINVFLPSWRWSLYCGMFQGL